MRARSGGKRVKGGGEGGPGPPSQIREIAQQTPTTLNGSFKPVPLVFSIMIATLFSDEMLDCRAVKTVPPPVNGVATIAQLLISTGKTTVAAPVNGRPEFTLTPGLPDVRVGFVPPETRAK